MRSVRVVIVACLIAAAGLIGLSVPAHAATHTVCASGCDFSSIAAAVSAAAPGDEIDIAAGTYNENSILVNKPLTITGAGSDATIVDGGSNTSGAGMFRIQTSGATAGPIIIESLRIQNPPGGSAGAVRFGIFVNNNGATTGISDITLRNLDIRGNLGGTSTWSYGIYAQGGNPIPAGGANRVMPPLTIEDSVFIQHLGNAIGIDGYNNAVTIRGNDLREGTAGNSAIVVGNSYINGRVTHPLLVDGNTSDGRLLSVYNFANPSGGAPQPRLGGFDEITVTNNVVTNLSGIDFGVDVIAWFRENDPVLEGFGSLIVEGNIFEGVGPNYALDADTQNGSAGVRVWGLVDDVKVSGNRFVGLDRAVHIRHHATSGSQHAQNVLVEENLLFANRFGVSNWTDADIDAPLNWWGCHDGPIDGDLTYCSEINNSTGGSVNVPSVVSLTANLDDTELDEGETTTVHAALQPAGIAASPFFADIQAFFEADNGSVSSSSVPLPEAFSAMATYTAPEDFGDDPVTDTIEVFFGFEEFGDNEFFGEPLLLTLTVNPASEEITPVDEDEDEAPGGETDHGTETDQAVGADGEVLPDAGATISEAHIALMVILLLAGAAVLLARCQILDYQPRHRAVL